MTNTGILLARLYAGDRITSESARSCGVRNPIQRIYEIKQRGVPVITIREGRHNVYQIDPAALDKLKQDVDLFRAQGQAAFADLPLMQYSRARYLAQALDR